MMGVAAAERVDVQRHARVVDEPLEEFVEKIDIEIPDPRTRKIHVKLETGPSRTVDDHPRQRLIERDVSMAVAPDPALVAERLRERLTDRDADVFDAVVRVDVQIAARFDLEVDQPVPRHLIEHMVEKGDPGMEIRLTGAIEIQRHADLGFLRIALYLCCAWAHGGSLIKGLYSITQDKFFGF